MIVTLPLSPTAIVHYFSNKDDLYDVDFDSSINNLTEVSMLLYLSNLGIKCNINKITTKLLVNYMTIKEFVDIPVLAETMANVLYFAKYGEVVYEEALQLYSVEDIKTFISLNMNMVTDQLMFLDSIFLFILSSTDDFDDNTIANKEE